MLSRRLSATRSGAKPGPCRRGPGSGRQSGIAGRRTAGAFVFEQGFERGAPAGAQRRNAQRPLKPALVAPGQIQQRIGLGDGHAFGTGQDLDDRVAGLDLALLEDAEVKARPVMRDDQRGHLRVVHPDAEAIAGHPRLRHLEQRAADPVMIADAHLRVGQAVDREILAELAVDEVVAAKLSLPVEIRFNLIDEDCAMLAAMAGEIALAIPVEVEPPRHATALHRRFPDAGVDSLALPRDVARETDIDRKQARHLVLFADPGASRRRSSREPTRASPASMR